MPIKILDPKTASKIAAGEVIEGPSSVVKELIENSIDAKASQILVKIENSGKKLIRVSDNGCGMSYDDLRLCLYRYATSKISDIEDLSKLSTYGFRGEALFSIFSVSRISITTFDRKSQHGYKLQAEGGEPSTITILPAPPVLGTTVEVKDLFFNLPARLKFLKSARSLNSSIIKTFESIALIHPEIRFTLYIDERKIYDLEKTDDLLKRIESILPIKADEIISSKERIEKLDISFYISKPQNLFPSKIYNYVYVNDRIVESKTVSNALYKAFEDIRGKRYPFFLIAIKIDPSLIDVNVHPQKREVRFKDETFVYNAVFKAIQNALLTHTRTSIDILLSQTQEKDYTSNIIEEDSHLKTEFFSEANLIDEIYKTTQYNERSSYEVRFIGQAFSKILIFQTPRSIILLDQHAAAERITFERYIQEYNSKNITKQILLVPVEVNLSSSQLERIMEIKEWLDKAGFEINQSSPTSIKVYSYPNVFNLQDDQIKEIMIYLSDITPLPKLLPDEIKRDIIATKACKASIRFNEFISEEKAKDIFDKLIKTSDPFRCPHGRPTMVEISKEELAGRFSRPQEQL